MKSRINKRNRDLKYKNRLKFLAQNCNGYPSPSYPVDKNGNYVHSYERHNWFRDNTPQEIAYYKRLYRGNHVKNRYKFYKKYANRCVRRYKGKIHKGCAYKRVFDFWWNVD